MTKRRSTKTMNILTVTAVGALALAGCGDDEATDSSTVSEVATSGTETSRTGTDDAQTGVTIIDVWSRTSPMMASTGAVYMTITAEDGDELLSAAVDASIARTAEVHETVMSDDAMAEDSDADDSMSTEAMSGQMTMRQVSSIVLQPGEKVQLMPGGYHIMLLDLVAPLEVGQTFQVTLTFAKAGVLVVTAEVRDEAP